MTQNVLFKVPNQRLIVLVVAATVITGGIAFYGISQSGLISQSASSQLEETPPVTPKISALGRLEPETEVISLSAPLDLDGDRIAQILVQEGDTVKSGQVVAILDSRTRLQTAVLQAEKQVQVAKAKLAQVEAGAKTGEIQAQQAIIQRLQAQLQGDKIAQQEAIARIEAQSLGERLAQEATINKLSAQLNNAQAEYERYQQLSSQGAISLSLFDSKRLSFDTAKQQLSQAQAVLNQINSTASIELAQAQVTLTRINATGNKQISEAKATLNSIAEIRPVDIAAAKSEVENAIATLKQMQINLESTSIIAPIAGQILKIHTRVGEKISEAGIADLAQTEQMIAVAQVYQTDISKVKLGQSAVITSQAFPGELRGTVSHIGLQVNRQNVFSNQPGENLDSRVIDVKIRLHPDDSKKVAGLTNLQVQTAINF
ncbi:ABC exporter membrane fusion protein [Nodularia spumigena CS-584]|jgi:HlyD family secretion protein|uniref:Macrolide export protein MacA n=2 Tax=Nodularia spumigena TaxID=70799 RepID=A0A2S0Q8X5_NODSP|nr:ABC exporter membrane fusion protein [Nodularia spumigena]AHJ30947.1 heterocyst specific ABC-transporter, membrane fusion protein DevB-like protein [Nodularia spumigena CCY9414]AVZ30750.1 macrolide export protein MacA [Nodularia spumigena UHCC 0039]EAW46403.1 heterocyst specific ABC-transporter, membrane fusion protein DevB [Nodularia spumigena CCY9414]MDB9382781.1 ABC exporter membrane fusion protein [Nodularia spumigena CS-584]MEA5523531.1 ABC exporter membrane fusion protein [Nodularia s